MYCQVPRKKHLALSNLEIRKKKIKKGIICNDEIKVKGIISDSIVDQD